MNLDEKLFEPGDDITAQVCAWIDKEVERRFLEIIPTDWTQSYMRTLGHMRSVENARNDLMGLNEELRLKIKSLEQGQEDLMLELSKTKSKLHDLGIVKL